MQSDITEEAKGAWRGLFASLGLSDAQLSGKHGPCPVCGGKDRFRFDDKEGRGTNFCSRCGAGDGFTLLQRLQGLDFMGAKEMVEKYLGTTPRKDEPKKDEPTLEQKLARLKRVWEMAVPISDGDCVDAYLRARLGDRLARPYNVRLHPNLRYNREVSYPAMVAKVQAPDGTPLTVHRTYLQPGGKKAPVPNAKLTMPGRPLRGGAIRLAPVIEGHIGIAEGLETALAAAIQFGTPVWSVLSANGIRSFEPPDGITRVTVYADNDADATGQLAAFELQRRLHGAGIPVKVTIPYAAWTDWCDELVSPVEIG